MKAIYIVNIKPTDANNLTSSSKEKSFGNFLNRSFSLSFFDMAKILKMILLFKNISPVKEAVGGGFGEVGGEDVGGGGEVGDGAGDLDYTGVRPGGEPHPVDQGLDELATGGAQRAEAFELLRAHLGVGEDRSAGEAPLLHLTGAQHPLRHHGARLRLAAAHKFLGINGMHPDLQVQAVH